MDNKIAIEDLVRSICEALVEYPDQLRVEVVTEEDSSTVQIHAHESWEDHIPKIPQSKAPTLIYEETARTVALLHDTTQIGRASCRERV